MGHLFYGKTTREVKNILSDMLITLVMIMVLRNDPF